LIASIEQEFAAVFGEDWKESTVIRFPPDEPGPEGKTDYRDTTKRLLSCGTTGTMSSASY